MKILHLSIVRRLSQGQRKQITYEAVAAPNLSKAEWRSLALHTDSPVTSLEKRLPLFFRPIFLRHLYAWLYMLRVARNYDFILYRYMTFDPFTLLFGWFVRNRIPIYHAKAIAELPLIRPGWRGRAASELERLTGWITSKQIPGALGVTRDIAEYQSRLYKSIRHVHTYPNGVDANAIEVLGDLRGSGCEAAFMCGVFSAWHGLDRLISAFRNSKAELSAKRLRVHLIGKLTPEQLRDVEGVNAIDPVFVVHGSLPANLYRDVLARCDIGLGSFAMDREGLTEGSTLKVREYLALGLPVYSGHRDTAIPEDHPFYMIGVASFDGIASYGERMKLVSRATVRQGSLEFIEKRKMMESVIEWLAALPR